MALGAAISWLRTRATRRDLAIAWILWFATLALTPTLVTIHDESRDGPPQLSQYNGVDLFGDSLPPQTLQVRPPWATVPLAGFARVFAAVAVALATCSSATLLVHRKAWFAGLHLGQLVMLCVPLTLLSWFATALLEQMGSSIQYPRSFALAVSVGASVAVAPVLIAFGALWLWFGARSRATL